MASEEAAAPLGGDEMRHEPVMLREAIDLLDPQPGETLVDCTLGGGGHAQEICRRLQGRGRLIGIDADESALERARRQLQNCPVTFVHDNFRNLDNILSLLSVARVDGFLLDLGVSSFQLDTPDRGFSFRYNAPLDMRLDRRQPTTAADLVNQLSEEEMVRLFQDAGYGGWSRRLARAVIATRERTPILYTAQFADLIVATLPAAYRRKKIHASTQAFQALRVAVNAELAALDEVLAAAVHHCNIAARIVVISFHSAEDREVKRCFQRLSGKEAPPPIYYTPEPSVSQPRFRILTKKPLTPDPVECRRNPRSRSAKLRAAECLAEDASSD